MSGSASVSGSIMTLGQLASTQMACEQPLMDQDDWIAEWLGGGVTWALDGDVLTLTADDVELELTDRRVADPDRPLQGTVWKLDGLVSADAVASVPGGVEASMTIENGKISVSTGCNGGTGQADVQGSTIVVTGLATTLMACPGDRTVVEKAMLTVLGDTFTVEIEANRLTATGVGGNGLMFVAKDAGGQPSGASSSSAAASSVISTGG